MKKLFCLFTVLLCIFCFFISCSSDVENETVIGENCSVSFVTDNVSKGLSISLSNNLTVSGTDSFYWQYEAVKEDDYGKSGATTTKTNINGSSMGLAKLENLSSGKWTFRLYAYVDNAFSKLIYKGEVSGVVLSADMENNVEICVERMQTSGVKGTLLIDPDKIKVGSDTSGEAASVVTPVSGDEYVDYQTDSKILGNLSDYSYEVYLCDEHFAEKSTLTTTRSSVYSAEYNSGPYYLKFKISKDNDAVSYVATLVLQIYDYCTTSIAEGSGINIKRLKEFKIEYKDEGGATFSGTHKQIDNGDGTFSDYPTSHQYGRAEELDEPTSTTSAFIGYYKDPACTQKITCIPPYQYEDITVYAKWDEISYSSISWVDNFPVAATTGKTASSGGSTQGKVGTAFTMQSNPVCTGYNFLGWYNESDVKITSVPQPTKHEQQVTYTAKWKPITYTIKFDLNKKGNSFNATNPNANIAAEYNLEDVILDCESDEKGFLGWSTYSDWSVGVNNLVGLDGYVKNLTTVDKATVTLYAIWSDYFKTLDYIRSYPSGEKTGPYINTLLSQAECSTIKMNVEIAGESDHWEILCGTGGGSGAAARNLNVGIYTKATDPARNDKWSNLNGNLGGTGNNMAGLLFEDKRYDIEVYSGSNGSYIIVDGEKILSDSNPVPSNGYKIGLFNQLNNNTTNRYCTDMRLYSCQMYNENGDILRKFVPCILSKKVDVAARSSDGLTTHNVNEIGLWDLKENKFYPNKMSGAVFHQPSEEVALTYHTNGGNGEDRVQKVLKGVREKMHKCLFSKNGSVFQSWNSLADGTGTETYDSMRLTFNAPQDFYAKWSKPTSWNLFGQVDYVQSHGTEYIDSGLAFGTFGGSFQITLTGKFDSTLLNNPSDRMSYPCIMGAYSHYTAPNSFPDHPEYKNFNGYMNGFIFRAFDNTNFSTHWLLYTDDEKVIVDNVINNITPEGSDQKFIATFRSIVGGASYTGIEVGGKLVADNYNTPSDLNYRISSKYKMTLYLFAMHSIDWQGTPWVDNGGVSNFTKGKIYGLMVDNCAGVIEAHYVPAVLNVDLTSANNVVDASGASVKGNSKVYGGKDCYAGEAGLWDIVNDKFYPNLGSGYLSYPMDEYMIRFDANGGMGVMENQVMSSGTDARIAQCRFQRDGYEFVGWTDQPSSSAAGVNWYSEERLLHSTELRNMTLFAQWRKKLDNPPYIQLDYIRNDNEGMAWIDTGYTTAKEFRVVYKINKTVELGADCPFGRSIRAQGGHIGTIFASNIYFNQTGHALATAQQLNVPVSVDAQVFNGLMAWDVVPGGTGRGVATEITEAGAVTDSLFGVARNGTNNRGCEFFYAKIYSDKDVLVRDFIPVMLTREIDASMDSQGKTRAKNTLGMWDKQNNKFYANARSDGKGYFVNDDIVTIVFNGNGADKGSMDSMAFVKSTDKTALVANKYSMSDGRGFVGWNTKADGTGIWYSDEYSANTWESGVLTLYAQWEKTAGLLDLDYFEPVNQVRIANNAYVNIGPVAECYVNCSFYNCDFSAGGFFMGADNYTSSHNVSGVLKRFNPNTISNGTIGADKMVISMNVGATGVWTDVHDDTKKLNKGACTYITVYSNPTTNKFGYSVSDGTNTYSTDLGSYSGNFICGNDWLLFASSRDNVYNPNAVAAKGGYCGGVKWLKQDGTVWFNMIPCRLTQKISSYVAGRLAADSSVHKVGEVGLWDIENNKFYGSAGTGAFTCELN